jgi:hypothetical protein
LVEGLRRHLRRLLDQSHWLVANLTGPRAGDNAWRVLRGIDLELLVHDDHYPAVIERVLAAQRSVWIATANLKELMIEDARLVPGRRRGRAQFRSVLSALSELSARGVELRILHAAPPSRVFLRDFDREKRLVAGGLELRLCPRNHLKLVIVDGRHLYFGSANWTGAGLGAKQAARRNFELGVLSDDERLLDAAQDTFHRIWRGAECAGCRMREECPMPLSEIERSGAAPTEQPRAWVRLRPRDGAAPAELCHEHVPVAQDTVRSRDVLRRPRK